MKRYLVVSLLLLATALRFHMLEAQSFWNDEGNSTRLSERSIQLILEGTGSDIHPPLYYLLLHGWRELLGDSEFGLRAFSAFVGVGVVAVTYALGRYLFTGRNNRFLLALLATFFAAISPALIYYSQEARMYALLALWAVLSTLFLLRLPRATRPVLLALAYVAVSVAGLYTHYSYPAVLLWQNLVVLLWVVLTGRAARRFPWRSVLVWGGMMLLTLLLYLPWLPIFSRQVGGRPGDAGSLTTFLADALHFTLFGETLVAGDWSWAAGVGLVIVLLGILLEGIFLFRRRPVPVQNAMALLVPILGFMVPALATAAVGATRPAFFKFLVVTIPFLALLLAQGTVVSGETARQWTGHRPGWRVPAYGVLGLAVLALLIAAGRSLQNLYTNPQFARADYRGIAAQIAEENHPNAGIILNAANQWEVFTYYYPDEAVVYPLPAGRPDPARITAALEQITATHDRLYALFWGEAERDPQRLVERWLDENAFKAREEWVGDVRFVTYDVPADPAGGSPTEAGVQFGEHITLESYTVATDKLRPGDIVQITLFWQTDAPLETRYKVFLHLLDEQGNIIAQRDSEPGGGLALTTTWPAGETIPDNHGVLIPPETPPGRYTLVLGLYDLTDPTSRLRTPAGDDSFLMNTIEVR